MKTRSKPGYKINGPISNAVRIEVIRILQTYRRQRVWVNGPAGLEIQHVVMIVLSNEQTDQDTVINTIKQLINTKHVAISTHRRRWDTKRLSFKQRTIRWISKEDRQV